MRFSLKVLLGVVFVVTATGATASEYPQVVVKTNAGDFVIELDINRAPLSVENFLQYVDEEFYNGVLFHRVVNGFVAQAGGFDSDMNPKTSRAPVSNESGNGLSNQRMTVAMARTNDPHSADSQFFVNLSDNVSLDPKPSRWGYAVFGKVISGTDVIDGIGHRAITTKGDFSDFPADPVIIETMERVPEPESE
jgi:cyclophilin family peptidyl-prolyl cis-trans isomerase